MLKVNKQNQYKLIQININERGHSLIGKTAILHIVNSGSSPDASRIYLFFFYLCF